MDFKLSPSSEKELLRPLSRVLNIPGQQFVYRKENMKKELSEYQTSYLPKGRINHHAAEQQTLYKVSSDILYSLVDSGIHLL